MEPRQSHSEQMPTPMANAERPVAGEFSLPNVEQSAWNNPERIQETPDVAESNRQVASAMPTALPTPVVATPQVAAAPSDDTPIVAADEDLIEKEWVDKAKQIIASTKDDPYRREQEIQRLQLDYVRKRYGKEIGATED